MEIMKLDNTLNIFMFLRVPSCTLCVLCGKILSIYYVQYSLPLLNMKCP